MRKTTIPLLITFALCWAGAAIAADDAWVSLGRALFFDVNLSAQRTQACATCHMPDRGFTDARSNAAGGAVSLGDDGESLGTRNTPTLSYVAQTPGLHIDRHGEYHGGLFYDGRAADLAAQATQPIVNPIEMALTDQRQLAQRVLENPAYVETLRWAEAHWLAGGMLLFSFVVILTLMLSQRGPRSLGP